MDNKKKVILINGEAGKWYEQVIFIINEKEKNVPKNIIFEAEKIINEYIDKKYNRNLTNKNINTTEIKSFEGNNIKKKAKKDTKKMKNYLNFAIFLTIGIIFCLAYLIWV